MSSHKPLTQPEKELTPTGASTAASYPPSAPGMARVGKHVAEQQVEAVREQATAVTPDFGLAVEGVRGLCPAGEVYAERNIAEKNTPVLACEGACIRGEIARLTANIVAQELPGYARACHAETFFVPHSAMTRWVKEADHSVMIDGCFLRCHGRVLNNLVEPERVVRIDANRIHQKYSEVFRSEDVPEDERKATARDVADRIIQMLTDSEQQ